MRLTINNSMNFENVEIINETFYPSKELTVSFSTDVEYNAAFENLEKNPNITSLSIITNDGVLDFTSKYNKVDRIFKKISINKKPAEGIQIVFVNEA